MSNSSHASGSLLHRFGVAGPARSHAFQGSGALARRRARAALSVFATALGALLFTTAPAFGEHTFSSSFGGPGSGPGQLSEPGGVAVNEETGDVYVVDRGNKRVEWFNLTGTKLEGEFNGDETPGGSFYEPVGIAVDNDALSPSHGDVYVDDATVVDKFSSTGHYLGQLEAGRIGKSGGGALGTGGLGGVAVAGNGEVWVYYQFSTNPIYEYSQDIIDNYNDREPNELEGSRESQARCCTSERIADIGVDSEENLYVGHGSFPSEVAKLNTLGEVLVGTEQSGSKVKGGEASFGAEENVSALALELSTNDVYIDNGSTVDRFSPSGGSPLERLGSGLLHAGAGVAASSSSGYVYVADAAADVVDLFTAATGPGISEEQATSVDSTAATLQAEVNPNRFDTAYHFEYDTSPYDTGAAHGTSVPVPSAGIGAGTSLVPVSVRLQGLQPGTSYYYRVVAEAEVSGKPETVDGPGKVLATPALPSTTAESCSNAQLRTEQPYGLVLPDCRAYELVSPIDTNGNNVGEEERGVGGAQGARAAVSGEGIAYFSKGSFGDPAGALYASAYISSRGPGGWSTQDITPPSTPIATDTFVPYEELFFTPDLSQGLLFDLETVRPLTSDSPAGYDNLYLADFAASSYQAVTDFTPPGTKPYEGSRDAPSVDGVSTDLSHVVFEQRADLTAGASGGRIHVYEWVGGKLSLVDVAPEGTTLTGNDQVGAPVVDYIEPEDVWHAVSENGSRVFFTAGEGTGGGLDEQGQLYVRENPTSPNEACSVAGDACTVEVSASQRVNGAGEPAPDPNDPSTPEDPNGVRPARFWGASADGSKVFFTSWADLTNDANTGPADDAANLYEYDLEDHRLTDLTVDTNAGDLDGAAVLGLVTAGEDGSYVYFVAEGELAANENGNEEKAVSGAPNLYMYHGGEVTFIARLVSGDERVWGGEQPGNGASKGGGGDAYGPAQHEARVSADGTRLAFISERSLTGYDNEAAQAGDCTAAHGGSHCTEVYLYDASAGAAGSLVCASCDPSGARPIGYARFDGTVQEEFTPYIPRNLSEDGSRLFFESSDALVPHAGDGEMNVYEYEDGQPHLLSDGAGNYDSYFLDASPSGDDVFIDTADQLLPQAQAGLKSVYDVRVGGGFPVAVAVPVCNNGDSCKPPVSPQPTIFGAPSSATFSGPGNTTPAVAPPPKVVTKKTVKCGKNFVKKKVKKKETCVKKKSKKRKNKAKKSAHINRRAK